MPQCTVNEHVSCVQEFEGKSDYTQGFHKQKMIFFKYELLNFDVLKA